MQEMLVVITMAAECLLCVCHSSVQGRAAELQRQVERGRHQRGLREERERKEAEKQMLRGVGLGDTQFSHSTNINWAPVVCWALGKKRQSGALRDGEPFCPCHVPTQPRAVRVWHRTQDAEEKWRQSGREKWGASTEHKP